jgi:hypothetical protein
MPIKHANMASPNASLKRINGGWYHKVHMISVRAFKLHAGQSICEIVNAHVFTTLRVLVRGQKKQHHVDALK